MSMLIVRSRHWRRVRWKGIKKQTLMLSHAIAVLLDCQAYDGCFDSVAEGVRQPSCICYPKLSDYLWSPKIWTRANQGNNFDSPTISCSGRALCLPLQPTQASAHVRWCLITPLTNPAKRSHCSDRHAHFTGALSLLSPVASPSTRVPKDDHKAQAV